MRRLAMLALLVLLAGLAGPVAAMTPEEQKEDALGARVLERFRDQLRTDDRLTHIAQFLRPEVKRTGLNWEFYVLTETDDLNAFALPGGKVVITEEYLNLLGDDELAFVLGHEMVHVDERHYVQMAKRRQSHLLGRLLLSILFDVGTAGQLVLDVVDASITSGYSRDLEWEADERGFDLAVAAGYDAAGGIQALSRLQAVRGSDWLGRLFATHPRLQSRMNRLEERQPAASGPTRMPYAQPGAVTTVWEYWGRAFLPEPGVPDLALSVEGNLVCEPAPELAVRAAVQEDRKFRVVGPNEDARWRLRVWVGVYPPTAETDGRRAVGLRAVLVRTDQELTGLVQGSWFRGQSLTGQPAVDKDELLLAVIHQS